MFNDPQYKPSRAWFIVKAVNLALSLGALIFFWIYNGFYSKQMLDESGRFSVSFLQNHPAYKYWAWIYTEIAYGVAMAAIYFMLFLLRRKHEVLLYFFIVTLENGVAEVIKLIMRDTRTCFQREEIAQKYCSCSFGQPSGHSSNTMIFFILLFTLFFEDFHKGYVANAIFIFFMVFIIFNVGMSRLFYGAHAYNQVILGYLIGYAFFSVYWMWSRRIKRAFAEILAKNPDRLNQRRVIFGLFFLAYLTLNALGLGFWYRNINNYERYPNHPSIITSCADKCLGKGVWLSDRHLASLAMVNTGMFLALLFAIFKGKKTLSSDNYYRDSWAGFGLVLKRLLVMILITSPVWAGWIINAFLDGWICYLVVTLLGLVFAVGFFFVQNPLRGVMGAEVSGDFFSNMPVQTYGFQGSPGLVRDIVDEPIVSKPFDGYQLKTY